MAQPQSILRRDVLDQGFEIGLNVDMLSPIQVARQCIDGMTRISQFGLNPDVDKGTVPEDLWYSGGLYPWQAAASAWTISSDSPADTATGTGARTVVFTGLNAGYAVMLPQTVALNGTAPVTIPGGPWFRFQELRVLTAGSQRMNVGTIQVRSAGGTVLGNIPPKRGRDKVGGFSVPADHTLYLTEMAVALLLQTNRRAHCTLWLRRDSDSGAAREAADFPASSDSYTRMEFVTPLRVPQKTDIIMRVLDISGNNGAVSGVFHGLLIDERIYAPQLV
jgi:hypothetical protein